MQPQLITLNSVCFFLTARHLPDRFHIKPSSLPAVGLLWAPGFCSSFILTMPPRTGCASKQAQRRRGEREREKRRIPLILSNWVAAFAAVHRMWETRDKKTSIYPSSPHTPPHTHTHPASLSTLLFPAHGIVWMACSFPPLPTTPTLA